MAKETQPQDGKFPETPQGMKSFASAFKRHDRPQDPSLPRIPLLANSPLSIAKGGLKSLQSKSVASEPPSASSPANRSRASVVIADTSPWLTQTRLGQLVNSSSRQEICINESGEIFMLKKTNQADGRAEFEILKAMSHENIIKVRDSFIYEQQFFLGLDYYRYTLEEILSVPLMMKERQVQYTASSIFSAIKFLAKTGIIHNQIDLRSIRVCGRTGSIVLSNFQAVNSFRQNYTSNTDLESLGLILIRSMSSDTVSVLEANFVREKRERNKLYGIRNAEHWSHCKLLIDFLDELFSRDKTPSAKLEKEHPFLSKKNQGNVFEAHIELVPLSCFVLWYPAPLE